MGLLAFISASAIAQDAEGPPPAPEASRATNKTTAAEPATKAPAKPAVESKEEEIDVSDLADEYWRPQKDDLEVVQNKRFTKSGRFEASLLYGFLQTHQYTDSQAIGASLNFHLSERWSVEASHFRISNKPSDFLTSVRRQFGLTPDFNNENSQTMGMVSWAPIYGKFALLGRKISHYDFYASLGAGVTETGNTSQNTANRFSWSWALGSRFFVWKNLLIRTEFRMLNYTDEVTVTQGSDARRNGGPGFTKTDVTRRNLVLGVGWLF